MRKRIATAMLASLAFASPQAIALGAESPVTATRNVHTECVQSDSQERCDAFFRDYMSAASERHAEEEAAAAANLARMKELRQAYAIAKQPEMLQPDRLLLNDAFVRVANRRRNRDPKTGRDMGEAPIKFFIDSAGVPYHTSVWPQTVGFRHTDFSMYALKPSDHLDGCPRLASLANPRDADYCVALEGVTFTPAETASGKRVAALLKGRIIYGNGQVNIEIDEVEPILFAKPNAPTERVEQDATPATGAPVEDTSFIPESETAAASQPPQSASVRAYSPSFLCSAASTATEHAICGNEQLALLDRMLAKAYSASLARLNGAQRSELMSGQKNWLKQRDADCGGDVACLQATIEDRLEHLLRL